MKIRRTFHISHETNKKMNDIYIYFMQLGKKQTYSDLLTTAIEVLRKKIVLEKESDNALLPKTKWCLKQASRRMDGQLCEEHCHNREGTCMPWIADCMEHYQKCSDGCHDECACQDK